MAPHAANPAAMPDSLKTHFARLPLAVLTLALAACAQMPRSGPTTKAVEQSAGADTRAGVIQVVDVNEDVARQLAQQQVQPLFSEVLGDNPSPQFAVGAGDTLEVTIWETPPAALFGATNVDPRVMATSNATVLPPQMVDREGFIEVPFAGRVRALGLTPSAIGRAIREALLRKANQPQVLVRQLQNASSTVSIVGEVNTNVRMPLTAAGERLLDALAVAGGTRQPVGKMSLQVTRGTQLRTLPLEQIIRDPRQNVRLQPGDVVTALYQPLSFTSLGATGRQEEIPFEAQGISLAQALGRVGGVTDTRSDPHGVFIFRFEPQSALTWPKQPAAATPDGMVPVIYRLDLADPGSFFAMQSFPMHHKDIVFVSNAPIADLQKFLNVVFSITFPLINAANALN
jgi:polysaccharide biosynthesis/export protein